MVLSVTVWKTHVLCEFEDVLKTVYTMVLSVDVCKTDVRCGCVGWWKTVAHPAAHIALGTCPTTRSAINLSQGWQAGRRGHPPPEIA